MLSKGEWHLYERKSVRRSKQNERKSNWAALEPERPVGFGGLLRSETAKQI